MFDQSLTCHSSALHVFLTWDPQILDGRGFGNKVDALNVAVTFAGETKVTPYSVGAAAHAWHCTLQWTATTAQLRQLTANGQNVCKVRAPFASVVGADVRMLPEEEAWQTCCASVTTLAAC